LLIICLRDVNYLFKKESKAKDPQVSHGCFCVCVPKDFRDECPIFEDDTFSVAFCYGRLLIMLKLIKLTISDNFSFDISIQSPPL